MTEGTISQFSQVLDNSKPDLVFAEVQSLFSVWYPASEYSDIHGAIDTIKALFAGDFPGYNACNTEYHNLCHTTDVLVAAARLFDGYCISNGAAPAGMGRDLYLAALLHDTGYIQESSESTGTGAKHTAYHVARSQEFARAHAEAFGIDDERIDRVCFFIECTNLSTNPIRLPFSSEEERRIGMILGTADLLGQMADRAYLEKLLFLYREFKEAGFPGYQTEFDILKNTLGFYTTVRERLDEVLKKEYELASIHFAERYKVRANLYIEAIERQMDYLREILDDDSSNFRKKLKRIDLEKVS